MGWAGRSLRFPFAHLDMGWVSIGCSVRGLVWPWSVLAISRLYMPWSGHVLEWLWAGLAIFWACHILGFPRAGLSKYWVHHRHHCPWAGLVIACGVLVLGWPWPVLRVVSRHGLGWPLSSLDMV
jgi:hypothetical protein